MTSSERPLYVPPHARNLSTGVSGQQPLGWCQNGTEPGINTCANGFSPTQDPSLCKPVGAFPEKAGCLNGTNVLYLCTVGSIVQPG
jgi:hypothetical protein